jgi:hypothetical protein
MNKPKELQRRAGRISDDAPGVRADNSSPSPLRPGDREPTTYFELERQKIADPNEPPSGAVPPLPSSSPWHRDLVPDEPPIDRTEDGDSMGVAIDDLSR